MLRACHPLPTRPRPSPSAPSKQVPSSFQPIKEAQDGMRRRLASFSTSRRQALPRTRRRPRRERPKPIMLYTYGGILTSGEESGGSPVEKLETWLLSPDPGPQTGAPMKDMMLGIPSPIFMRYSVGRGNLPYKIEIGQCEVIGHATPPSRHELVFNWDRFLPQRATRSPYWYLPQPKRVVLCSHSLETPRGKQALAQSEPDENMPR